MILYRLILNFTISQSHLLNLSQLLHECLILRVICKHIIMDSPSARPPHQWFDHQTKAHSVYHRFNTLPIFNIFLFHATTDQPSFNLWDWHFFNKKRYGNDCQNRPNALSFVDAVVSWTNSTGTWFNPTTSLSDTFDSGEIKYIPIPQQ